MKTALFLLATFTWCPPWANAQGNAHIRVISFETTDMSIALESTKPDCDDSLFAKLTAEAVSGRAKVVQDQMLATKSGQRAIVDQGKESPHYYPVLGNPMPIGFEYHRLGQVMQIDPVVTANENDRFIEFTLAPETISLLSNFSWPVPNFSGAGRMGQVTNPVIGYWGTYTSCTSWTGKTLFLGMANSPGTALSNAATPVLRYTFARAGFDGDKPTKIRTSSGEMGDMRRLHAVTFRLPRNTAASLLLQSGDDAALYQLLTNQGSPKESLAIVCKLGQRANVDSHVRFPIPSKTKDMQPTAWEVHSHRIGVAMQVEANIGDADPDTGKPPFNGWDVSLDSREAPELVESHPDPKRPELYGAVAEHTERHVYASLSIPATGIRLASITSTTPATETDQAATTDVTFLLQSPLPAKFPTPKTPQLLMQCCILSVPESEGPAWAAACKSGNTKNHLPALMQRLVSGDVTCATHAALVLKSKSLAKVEYIRHGLQPTDFLPSESNPELKLPSNWKPTTSGMTMEVNPTIKATGDCELSLKFSWDTAALQENKPRCVQELDLKHLSLSKNCPILADARPSGAPEGSSEYRRWHLSWIATR